MPDGAGPGTGDGPGAGGEPAAGEDAKLVTLARSAAARAGGTGAAVRDDLGRTYVAGAVTLRSLVLTPVQAAVAAAVSSGAGRLDAVAVWGTDLQTADRDLLAELGDPSVLAAGR